jgi:CheY-like chemotaxis protein
MNPATLLIIEDNLAQQLVYRQLCEIFDCAAVFCSSGEDALEAVALARYAAVLVDLKLPGIDGVETVRRLRQFEGITGHRTSIIALTASNRAEDEKALRHAGVDDFMTKPFVIDDFRKLLLRQIYNSERPNLKLLMIPNNAQRSVGY